jgi:iron(III) transport system substrate-binding protein
MQMKRWILVLFVVAVSLIFLNNASAQDAQTKWLKKAQLGPHAPAKQDWTAIEAAARKEGQVVIYSVSSRIFKLQKEFKEAYGVEIVGFDMNSDEQNEKFGREHKAGLYNVDVLFHNGTADLIGKFLPNKMIWNFIPNSVAPLLADNEKEPFLVQRWSSRVFLYNTALNPSGPPIDNIWDATRKEWMGKILTPDPTSAAMANFYQTILEHPKEIAAAYKKEFGVPVKLSSGTKNAAEEWMLRFMQNNPAIMKSTTKIFRGISDVKQENPPLGLTTFSKLRDVKKGVYESAPIYDMDPVFGVAYPTVLLIADQAPHPNAAKLLIRFMMDKGFWPWNVLGDYAARSDVEAEQLKKYNLPPFEKTKMWRIDPKRVFDSKYDYMQFYMSIAK